MFSIAKLFGKSPFSPLQTHMKKVSYCMEKLVDICSAFLQEEHNRIDTLSKQLSELEHEADITKNDIRNHLPKSLFLPIDRSHFLDILSTQDRIADQAEDLALLLSFKAIPVESPLKERLHELSTKTMQTFLLAKKIIEELDTLLETSFGGIEAEKVKNTVERTAYMEHEVRQTQRIMLKDLLALSMPNTEFYMWERIIQELGTIAALAESLANKIRVILEIK